jgi:hypothetical protein|eukprot:COSAG01_NODE_3135_length_6528_cov_7.013841_2_plen_90_part_00
MGGVGVRARSRAPHRGVNRCEEGLLRHQPWLMKLSVVLGIIHGQVALEFWGGDTLHAHAPRGGYRGHPGAGPGRDQRGVGATTCAGNGL